MAEVIVKSAQVQHQRRLLVSVYQVQALVNAPSVDIPLAVLHECKYRHNIMRNVYAHGHQGTSPLPWRQSYLQAI